MDNTTAATNLTDGMHILTESLMANGVSKMYGVVGIPVTDFARIAQAKGIRYIGMRHEADAGNAAAAEGFLTGKPGVFLTVSAPGFLNGITPLKEATENGWPCIMIGGSSTRNLVDMGEGDYEGLDQMNFAKPFCKASFRVDNLEDIPLAVARAMRIALSGRPGGVYIDFPGETMGLSMDADAAKAIIYTVNDPCPAMVPSQTSVDAAMKLLAGAKNPWIILGKGAAYAQADEEIQNFIHATGIPFQPMSMAKGLLPDDDPLATLSCRGLAMRTADVVLLVGARLNWMLQFGKGKKWNPDVKFIQIEIDPAEIDNSRYIDAPIVGDIKSTMKMMNEALKTTPVKASAEWQQLLAADIAKNDARFAGKTASSEVPMNHYNALGAVKKVMDKNHDVYLVNEGANTLDDCRDIVNQYLPRHRLDCGTWGVMGVGLGYAIGAAVTTGKPVGFHPRRLRLRLRRHGSGNHLPLPSARNRDGAEQRRHLPRRLREPGHRRRPLPSHPGRHRPLREDDGGLRRQGLLRHHPRRSGADADRGHRLEAALHDQRSAVRTCRRRERPHWQPEPETGDGPLADSEMVDDPAVK